MRHEYLDTSDRKFLVTLDSGSAEAFNESYARQSTGSVGETPRETESGGGEGEFGCLLREELSVAWEIQFARMDFNMKKLVKDAGAALSRVVQVGNLLFFFPPPGASPGVRGEENARAKTSSPSASMLTFEGDDRTRPRVTGWLPRVRSSFLDENADSTSRI